MGKIIIQNQTTPATPDTGKTVLYPRSSDKKLCYIDDTGLEQCLTTDTDTGETNTASNVGVGGVGVFKQKTGVNLEFRNINAGSSKVTVTNDSGNNEIDLDVAEGNIVHQNLSGAGTNTHAQIDSHIANTSNPHSVTAAQVGAAATASNVGVGGVGVFKQKTGTTLELKNINAGSSKITITDDTGNNEIDVDVVESNLTLNNIGGTLGVTKGGTGTTTQFTQGSVVFAGASGVYSQNNANFFWDDVNARLGLGDVAPAAQLAVKKVSPTALIDLTGSGSHFRHFDNAGTQLVYQILDTANTSYAFREPGGGTDILSLNYSSKLVTVASALRIGTTAAMFSSHKLMVGGKGTNFADTQNSFVSSYTGTATQGYAGIECQIDITPDSASTSTVYGISSAPYFRAASGGGMSNAINAFTALPANLNVTQTVGVIRGFHCNAITTAGGVVNSAHSFAAGNNSAGGTNVSFYTAQNSGATNYAVYTAGTAKSYFGGRIGIGVTSPAYDLDVFGSLGVTAASPSIVVGPTAGVGVTSYIAFTSGRATFGYDGVRAMNYIQAGSGKGIVFDVDGTTERIRVLSTGESCFNSTASYGATVNVTCLTANNGGLYVRGAASQVSDLFQFQNSSGTVLSTIKADGSFGIGTSAPAGQFQVNPSSASVIGQRIALFTSQSANAFEVRNSGGTAIYQITAACKVIFDSTITNPGTTGNQTINKPSGTVNIAAAGTTVTVTNSLCTTSSIVLAVVRTNDTTAEIKNVVPSSGSFVINMSAAVTAETSIGFIVYN